MPRADDRLLSAGPGCRVPGSEVTWRFGPTGGPGGQHANRAHTRVEAELDLRSVRGIDDDIRERLVARLGPRLRVVVDRHRSQARNRERALDEMELRIREALVVQRSRRPTRPRRGAVERRLEAKRQQGARKAERRRDWD
ncbi:MAG: peptide chain release factor-like protein [Acidimicrobiales bacterium]|jgi:ribosome-associated protein|nr:aminoacyl-tRNA hydrolase [Acidimicrobiaceae bacterium]MBT5568997.1 aminoacyl-tRNA hydrolase [Acidimicrobiaceae bacterium]MBT6091257.1 aminoacyl-tRNA hydrolase [Acidimicrobiaceae bacterium]MDE0834702.1 aminoacyl-tRNA hydrolase [Acidimicrobiales bacterium]MDG2160220.1 peptide chain release factor-like protein [Acidimicrobiales bacterium]|tara:strand:+ start:1253 stop:1672 length:420 start_codon:yes stop_codon:yes gene_type:complete